MIAIGRLFGAILAAVLLAGSVAAREGLETRAVAEDVESPKASTDQLAWLVGSWEGRGVRGAPAMESWTAPVGGTMVGTFIQQNSDGSVMFTELMYIRPVEIAGGESLEIAIKHFNPDLTGWEEKTEVERFRLVAIEDCAAYFQGLTIRCADKAAPGEGVVVAVRAGKDEEGNVKELVFRYQTHGRRNAAAHARCPDALTTRDIDQCFADILAKADLRRIEYSTRAMARHDDRPELVDMIKASEAAFVAYRDAECGAVLQDWIEGTIRGFMTLSCRIEITDRRTRTIWQNWLTYMDSTPPILPEPEPMQ